LVPTKGPLMPLPRRGGGRKGASERERTGRGKKKY